MDMGVHTPGAVCPTEEELDSFIDSGEAALASHVQRCEECRARLEDLKADRRLMKELSRVVRPPKPVGSFPEIPGFELVAELHRGGQGVVYRAVQLSAHRDVALKVLLHGPWATDRQRRRFEREIDLAARLQHPNIVTVFASGVTEDGRHYFAMEHVDGVPLDESIGAEKVEDGSARGVLARRLELFRGVCAGVGYAHQRGVIHRDLKPSNILIDREGRARVLDFGLAKSMEEPDGPTLSLTGEFLGTPAYASPEHTRGDPDLIDVRSDVYSLGVILYEMLTGHLPYPVTGSMAEALRAITQADPEKPGSWYRRSRNSSAPGDRVPLRVDSELETVILKALAKEPERRYQSVEELSRDLERYLTGQPIGAHPDSSWYVIRKTLARHRVPVATGMGFVVLVAAFGVGAAVQNRTIRTQRDTIKGEATRADAERHNVERINGVLTKILEQADPHQAQGHEATVSEVLANSDSWLSKDLQDAPEIEARVRRTIGGIYQNLGKTNEAATQLEKSIALFEKLGREDLEMADALTGLGEARQTAGRLPEAEELGKRSLAMMKKVVPEDDPRLGGPLALLARLAYVRNKADESEALSREILRIRQKSLGDDDPQTINSLLSIAASVNLKGDLVQAERITREALGRLIAISGEKDHEVLIAMNNHMVCLKDLGRVVEAEEIGRRLIPLRIEVQGAENPETLGTQIVYGRVLIDLARYDQAEEVLKTARDKYVAKFGKDHPRALMAMSGLASMYLLTGRESEAVVIRREILELRMKTPGAKAGSPRIIPSEADLAEALEKSGAIEEAAALCEKTLEAHKAAFGAEHPNTLRVRDLLAQIRADQGKMDEADAMFKQTLGVRRAHPQAGDVPLASTLKMYGLALERAGRHSEAAPILEEATTLEDRMLGSEHPVSLKVREALVRAYEGMGDTARAETARHPVAKASASPGS
jgi:serine/threonine protein kinase